MLKSLKNIPATWLALLLVAIPHLLFVVSKWHGIPLQDGTPIGQTDPDTWLRLTLVHDWLSGGSWYDHYVSRTNAPIGGIASPWTRPVDLVLAALATLQPESVELKLRLMRAAMLAPWLYMVLLMAGIHQCIRSIMPLPSAHIMAGVLIATMPVMWNYFGLGNADHHAPLAAIFVWAMAGIFVPTPSRRTMVVTGILFGLQLWLSVEAIILIALVYLWLGMQWLRGDQLKANALAWLSTSIALTSFAALMIERPMNAWAIPIYDSISIAYIYALAIAALFAWGLQHASFPTLRHRLVISIIGTAIVLASIGAVYPQLLHGPMVGVHPFIISDFLPRITEAQPFYKIPVMQMLPAIVLPLAAFILCLAPWIERKRAFYGAQQSAKLAFFMGTTLALFYYQQRWSYYSMPLAIVITAPLLGALFTPEHPRVARHWPASLLVGLSPNQQMKKRLPVLLALLGTPAIIMLAQLSPNAAREIVHSVQWLGSLGQPTSAKEKAISNTLSQREACYSAARQLIRSGELNRALPRPKTILIPTDLGTEILYFTPHRIIASNYHREGAGIEYVWNSEKITSETRLRTHLKARKVTAILTCPVIDAPTSSILKLYRDGKPLPTWLQKITYTLPTSPAAKASSKPTSPTIKPLLLKVVGE